MLGLDAVVRKDYCLEILSHSPDEEYERLSHVWSSQYPESSVASLMLYEAVLQPP